ncbi:MAG: hypothetical protein KKF10_06415, partial [Verrucomicrobia bacterium]|nr:hypothetical protein [Verrucomicrobiota bacterium]
MRTIIILAFGLFFACAVQAQVGSSISADGTAPNDNAMLDVQSPATGAGKGMLIPRITLAQRTTSSAILDGGLLDNSGNLRGGAAQGLIVYQTDSVQGLYFNTSQTAAPAWVHLGEGADLDMQGNVITNATYYGDGRGITNLSAGAFTETDPLWASASNAIVADIATRLASNVWAAADSTTNYLAQTGGTMSGALNMGEQIITNVAHIDFNGNDVSVGRGANGSEYGAAVGRAAVGTNYGMAMGYQANGCNDGVAVGYQANGSVTGVAVGASANGYKDGVAVGYLAKGTNYGAAVGRNANGSSSGAALGYDANGYAAGAAMGRLANGFDAGAALGYDANGFHYGVAVGA